MGTLVRLRHWLIVLLVGVALGSCSPERRAVLRLTALNFKNQANDAIESVKLVYQLNPVSRSSTERQQRLLKRLLADPNLNFADAEQVLKIIDRELRTNPLPSPVNAVLDDLKQEYIVAGETFNNIEEAGVLGLEAGAVSRAAEPARRLTVKMLLLAELIAQNPPSPRNPDRVAIFFQFSKLSDQYRRATTDVERATLMSQASVLLDNLLSVNSEEKQALCQARAKLLLTADTGVKLSQLIENYNKLSFDEVVSRINTTLGIASSFGADITVVNARIAQIQRSIQDDDILNQMLNEQRRLNPVVSTDTPPLDCSN